MEAAIIKAICDVWKAVPGIGKVWDEEALATLEEDDKEVSTTPDPVSALPRTDIVIVSLEGFTEGPYTSDQSTQITLRYAMGYDLEFARWKKEGLEFKSSVAQFKAVLMRARKKFKETPQLGYHNVSHKLLQMGHAGLTFDDETGGRFSSATMSLTVIVSGFAA